jgi:hypothetical protein
MNRNSGRVISTFEDEEFIHLGLWDVKVPAFFVLMTRY